MTAIRSIRDKKAEIERAGWGSAIDDDSWLSLESFLAESAVTVAPSLTVFSDGELEAWWPVYSEETAGEERTLSVRFKSSGEFLIEKRDEDLEINYWTEVKKERLLDFVNTHLPTQ